MTASCAWHLLQLLLLHVYSVVGDSLSSTGLEACHPSVLVHAEWQESSFQWLSQCHGRDHDILATLVGTVILGSQMMDTGGETACQSHCV